MKTPTLDQLFDKIAMWQSQTFPSGTAASAVDHLRREANELWDVHWEVVDGEAVPRRTIDAAENDKEWADIFHLLVAVAVKTRLRPRVVIAKVLGSNQTREWQEPDERGVVEHKRG